MKGDDEARALLGLPPDSRPTQLPSLSLSLMFPNACTPISLSLSLSLSKSCLSHKFMMQNLGFFWVIGISIKVAIFTQLLGSILCFGVDLFWSLCYGLRLAELLSFNCRLMIFLFNFWFYHIIGQTGGVKVNSTQPIYLNWSY
jgi:hypothetical protein